MMCTSKLIWGVSKRWRLGTVMTPLRERQPLVSISLQTMQFLKPMARLVA